MRGGKGCSQSDTIARPGATCGKVRSVIGDMEASGFRFMSDTSTGDVVRTMKMISWRKESTQKGDSLFLGVTG
jgi:hypothetical protein